MIESSAFTWDRDESDLFAEINEHFTELRTYIDFGLTELHREVSSGFQRLERKVDLLLDKLL